MEVAKIDCEQEIEQIGDILAELPILALQKLGISTDVTGMALRSKLWGWQYDLYVNGEGKYCRLLEHYIPDGDVYWVVIYNEEEKEKADNISDEIFKGKNIETTFKIN